jgi:phospho-N-acetylmuramoyl-pentapeptide-transferase
MSIFQEVISYLILGIVISGLLSIPIINLLYSLKIVRQIGVDFSTIIEERKSKYGTPIMGGLIVVIPVVLITMLFNRNSATLLAILIFVAAALLGGIDDVLNIFGKHRKARSLARILKLIRIHKSIKARIQYVILLPWLAFERFMHMFESNPGTGLRAHEKLLVQLTLGGLLGLYVYDTAGGYVWLPLIKSINIGMWIIPVAILVFGAMTNAVNISDGMDGLAAGMLLNAFAGLLVISYFVGNIEITLLNATIIGAIITYLYFNIAPARVQFGDTGSFSMGAILTVIGFLSGKFILLAIIGLPFMIELGSTIVQSLTRRLFGRRILMMAPLHHHFEMLGWKEEKVVMRFWLYSLIANVIGVWISFF